MTHPVQAAESAAPTSSQEWFAEATSVVEIGDQRGRLLGFPTANLHPPDCEDVRRGVYAAVARAEDGVWWPAAVNIGTRPTFTLDEARLSIEVHLIGFDGDLYGQRLTVRFLAPLRAEERFESVHALVRQLAVDVASATEIVRRSGLLVENAR
jgi:riboflavin kinase/FMN adenylyltransferase